MPFRTCHAFLTGCACRAQVLDGEAVPSGQASQLPPLSLHACAQYADMDCSTSGYAGCEDMKDKVSPIAASMKAKLLACRC